MINSIKYAAIINDKKIENEIRFGRKNFIIGTKGGGKSTLLKLLWNLSSNRGPSKIINQAYSNDNWDVKFISAIIDGTEISFDNLTKGIDILKDDSSNYEDIVLQNDSLKVSIDDSSSFKKYKDKLKEEVVESISNELINKITPLIDSANDIIHFKNELSVNESILHGIDSNKKSSDISKLREMISPSSTVMGRDLEKLSNYQRQIKQIENYLEQPLNINKMFEEKFDKNIMNLKEQVSKKLSEYNKILFKGINRSESALNEVVSKVEVNSENYFQKQRSNANDDSKKEMDRQKLASNINKLFDSIKGFKVKFNSIVKESSIEINKVLDIQNYPGYSFRFNKKLRLDVELLGNLIDKFLYAPTDRSSYSKWIKKTLDKGALRSNISYDKMKKIIKKTLEVYLEQSVNLFIGEKNYSNLSMGQRSISMLTNKINSNTKSYFFIDQPEDNLDNKTIYEEIVAAHLLNKDASIFNKQSFIVTHNANIGILGYNDVEDIIIHANLNDNGYVESKISGEKQSSISILEGGKKPLINRYNKTKGNN